MYLFSGCKVTHFVRISQKKLKRCDAMRCKKTFGNLWLCYLFLLILWGRLLKLTDYAEF